MALVWTRTGLAFGSGTCVTGSPQTSYPVSRQLGTGKARATHSLELEELVWSSDIAM